MGMIRRSIMPLLSTLAALVILVHSAEEDMENRQLALRQSETSGQDYDYDQTWRAIRSEPMMQESKEWNEPRALEPEDRPRRRRLGRKRKRRPTIEQPAEPEARRHYHEEPQARQESEYTIKQESTEHARKRRKRPEMRPWVHEENGMERPLRRRGQRRKRPKFNEFNSFHGYEPTLDNQRPLEENFKEDKSNDDPFKKPELIEIHVEPDDIYDDSLKNMQKDVITDGEKQNDVSVPGSFTEENSSVMKLQDEEQILTPEELNNVKKPAVLKDLLKKLNGSSLIEFLQEHNLTLTDLLKGDKKALLVLEDQNNFTEKTIQQEELSQYQNNKYNSENDFKENKKQSEKSKDSIAIEITYIYNTSKESDSPKNKTELSDKDISVNKAQSEILDVKENSPKIARHNPIYKGRRRIRVRKPETVNAEYSRRPQRQNQPIPIVQSDKNKDVSNTESPSTISTLKPESTTQDSDYLENNELITSTIATSTTDEITTTEDNYEGTENNDLIYDTTTNPTTTVDLATIEIRTETESPSTTTEKNIITSILRQKPKNISELRRQALTNRLKRKRLRQKASTDESIVTSPSKDQYGMTNLISASEFVAHSPKTTISNDLIDTTLEDFFVTEASTRIEKPYKSTPNYSSTPSVTKVSKSEETAKIEIAEILKDDYTNARLSKILMERNMTLNELLDHRERGSSNVHLADIFHNASREPNPPEPFLSKSSIAPISKEIYPLRALLEANHHDPVEKFTTVVPSSKSRMKNVPVVMNYKNNVNENGENMGIMSLFDKLTNNLEEHPAIKKDSDGTPYVASITAENVSISDTQRAGRELVTPAIQNPPKESLNELFSFMVRTYSDGRKQITESMSKQRDQTLTEDYSTKATLHNYSEENSVVMSEDLQHLKEFNSNIASASDEDMEMNMTENDDTTSDSSPQGVLDRIPNGTKSVTVATASILGLTMVVFLLTYVLFKWKQQRNLLRNKESFAGERIPTPVFESRKGNKNQSSTRSISPMLSSANNIYTMNTLDSRNGKESPEYMWDSLRKPFQ